ncbi:MAG: hypothetical protein K8R68_04415 [Bacteroidales bacterium]|nr:hypothetical protein [Bacteroidales bacterium]
MARKDLVDHNFGKITSGLERQNNLVLKTIAFVYEQLPKWRDDPDRSFEQSENRLNLQLCKYLKSSARHHFPMVTFDHEEYQYGPRSVDLSVSPIEATVIGARQHTIYDPILVLECKRLPAPSSDREKEYITGGKEKKSGGIQRFKLGLHGADLELVAIIGYLQENSARVWFHKINDWISELCQEKVDDACVWSDDEILDPICENVSEGLASYRSVHCRINSELSNEMEIHHLWIEMNTERA